MKPTAPLIAALILTTSALAQDAPKRTKPSIVKPPAMIEGEAQAPLPQPRPETAPVQPPTYIIQPQVTVYAPMAEHEKWLGWTLAGIAGAFTIIFAFQTWLSRHVQRRSPRGENPNV